jgi:release factor glutamine methyltransferase
LANLIPLIDAGPPRLDKLWAAAIGRLTRAGIDDAALEAEVLLRCALDVDRAAFLAMQREPVPGSAVTNFEGLLARREGREPLAYITGHREFYGMDFAITPAVLVPRQETELLVDLAIKQLQDNKTPGVLDVGTGSGCVALAIAAHAPNADVHAVDLSEDALAVAGRNREAHGLTNRVTFHPGDLLSPFIGTPARWHLIVSNPPYIPSPVLVTLGPEVRAEPRMALDGGPDGLDPTRELMRQAADLLADGGRMLIEIFSDAAPEAARLAHGAFPDTPVTIHNDLLGLQRVLEIGPVARP